MLPMMLLQPSDLATFDTALNSAKLLPPEASEPSAAFADILNLGLEAGQPAEIPLGTLLPQAGNVLPPPVLPDFVAVSGDDIEGVPIPNLAGLRVELRPATPAAGHSPLSGGAVAAAAPMPQSAPLASIQRPVLPPTQLSLMPAEPDAATLIPVSRLPHGGRPVDAAALTPVPQPGPEPQTSIGQIARDLAATPVTGTGAAPLVDEAASGTRKASPPAALRVPENMAELSRRPVRSAEPLVPVTPAAGDEVSGEIRPLPAMTSTTPAVQPQLQPVNAIEIPAGQLAQVSPLQLTPAQSAAAPDSAALTTQLTQSIDVPVKDQAWGDRIGERVLLMASNRLQSAEIRLTPAELGPLRIQIAVDDGAANVTFLAQHAVTRDAIEQALPRLRELLAENGLTLNETNVGGHSEQGVHEGNPDNSDDPASLAKGGTDSAGDTEAADNPAAPGLPNRPNTLVDTFV